MIKGIFPKAYFPSGNFPRVFSQMCNFPSLSQPQHLAPQPVLAAALGPLAHPSRSARPLCSLRRLKRSNITLHINGTFGKLPLVKLSLRKSPFWKMPLGKYLTPNQWTATFDRKFNFDFVDDIMNSLKTLKSFALQ